MRHILKPLFRHPSMPLLVVVQVALACTIACNALSGLQQKLAPLTAPDGIGDPNHLLVVTGLYARGKPWGPARLHATEAALRHLPGVKAVSYAATLPMTGHGTMLANIRRPQGKTTVSASIYLGDNLLQTLDLRLVAGRDFTAAEKRTTLGSGMGFHQPGVTIISRALADRLFPDRPALGQIVQAGPSQRTVVGIVAHLMRNQIGGDNRTDLDDSMLFPGTPAQWPVPRFAVRTSDHADTPYLRQSIRTTLQRELGSERLPGTTPMVETFTTLRARMLAPATAAVWLFLGVTIIVLIVTLAGIMGMTGYWVRQRTKQIGIRRAVGARRRDIFRAFQIENLLVVGTGTALGMIAAYVTSGWLMHHYALSRLPLAYLPLGTAMFLMLGQLAVLLPARRATGIAPLVATRTM